MTNAIPAGTCNIAINVPRDERQELGRLATSEDCSIGGLIRRLTLRGLQSELAEVESKIYRSVGFVSRDGEIKMFQRAEALRQTLARLTEIRRQYYGAALLALFLTLLVSGPHEMRRARGRRVEEQREEG